MSRLRYQVLLSNGTLPIHFSSMKQAIRVAEHLSPAGWTIRLTHVCAPQVCCDPMPDCAAGRGAVARARC